MKLYLNDKERSLDFLKLLEIMLGGALSSTDLKLDTKALIENTPGIIDPVQDFIDYYIQDSMEPEQYDANRIAWIKNALYSAKGAPQIFEIFQEAFGVTVRYQYDFPKLSVVDFSNLRISNVILFINKFKTLTYHLLYYTEISITIRDLILNIIGNLTQYNYTIVQGFHMASPKLVDHDF